MNRKIFTYLALIVSMLALTFAQAPTASFAADLKGPVPPPPAPTLPATGQLSAADLRASTDASIADALKSVTPFDKRDAKLDTAGLDAAAALMDSLRGKQADAFRQALLKHTADLGFLANQGTVALPSKDAKTPSLADAKKLDSAAKAWKAALDADVAKVLTPAQMQLWQAASMTPPTLDANVAADVSGAAYCSYCYSAYYYAYYAQLYGYYGYLYSLNGYYLNRAHYSFNYDYSAFVYAYTGYDYARRNYTYAVYTYTYRDVMDAAMSYAYSYPSQLFFYNAYVQAYWAYVSLYDYSGGYYLWSYQYNDYARQNAYNAYYYAYYSLSQIMH